MRIYYLTIFTLLLFFPLAGYARDTRHTFKEKGVSVSVPEDWKVLESKNCVNFLVNSLEADEMSISICVNHQTIPPGLDEWLRKTLANFERFPQVSRIDEKGERIIDGVKTRRFNYFLNDTEQMREILIKGHLVYEMTSVAKRETFNKNRDVFEKILMSLQFND